MKNLRCFASIRNVLLSVILLTPFFSAAVYSQSDESIIINNDKINVTVDKGQVFSTQCFSFKAKVKSLVQGRGCRVMGTEQIGMPFIEVELLGGMHDKSLDQAGDFLLEGIADIIAKSGANRSIKFMKPGPLDSSNEGKYIGKKKTTVDGLPALEFRWAIGKEGSYSTVRVRTLVELPKKRFVWDEQPISYMLMYGMERGFKAAMYNEARNTLDIL